MKQKIFVAFLMCASAISLCAQPWRAGYITNLNVVAPAQIGTFSGNAAGGLARLTNIAFYNWPVVGLTTNAGGQVSSSCLLFTWYYGVSYRVAPHVQVSISGNGYQVDYYNNQGLYPNVSVGAVTTNYAEIWGSDNSPAIGVGGATNWQFSLSAR